MKPTAQDRLGLEAEMKRLVEQSKDMGAVKVILFGSLARGQLSLFSDIDLLVLFDQEQSARELTRWVYQNIQAREEVDILAYSQEAFQRVCERPFFRQILKEGKVLYERAPPH
ncbi:MAG: nucleotidyltransferase domain-containing protein [Chloroflexi bacterium]|nr:nucleotidyltransferase domain-containing protein [Chloroflexota bacterium]